MKEKRPFKLLLFVFILHGLFLFLLSFLGSPLAPPTMPLKVEILTYEEKALPPMVVEELNKVAVNKCNSGQPSPFLEGDQCQDPHTQEILDPAQASSIDINEAPVETIVPPEEPTPLIEDEKPAQQLPTITEAPAPPPPPPPPPSNKPKVSEAKKEQPKKKLDIPQKKNATKKSEKSKPAVKNNPKPSSPVAKKPASKKNPSKPSSAAPNSSTTNVAKNANQEKLLSMMQSSLSQLESCEKKSGKGIAGGSSGGKGTGSGSLPALKSENIVISGGPVSYTSELTIYLKHQLTLPEKGDVRMKLSLSEKGEVIALAIISSSSEKNRTYVQKRVPSLHFPPLPSEKQETFFLTLKGE